MRKKYDGIKLLNSYDIAFGYYVEKSMNYVDSFDFTRDFKNINEVIEIYNVHEILSQKNISKEIVIKYEEKIKDFIPIVARFFKGIIEDNFENTCNEVAIGYVDEFWILFDKFKVYEQISDSVFSNYINNPNTTLYEIWNIKIKKYIDSAKAFGENKYITAAKKATKVPLMISPGELFAQMFLRTTVEVADHIDKVNKEKKHMDAIHNMGEMIPFSDISLIESQQENLSLFISKIEIVKYKEKMYIKTQNNSRSLAE